MTSPRRRPRTPADPAALGATAGGSAGARSARSRPRCGPGSRPPAGPSRRSSPSSSSGSEAEVAEIDAAEASAARRSGRSSTTPTSRPAPSPPTSSAQLRRRGCLVVRGHFPREQALAWDRDIVDYVESNRFFENYRGPGDDFFGSVGSKPEIYPIYWSPAQMQARQSDRMARVQAFLNRQWKHESDGVRWFDPDRDSLYPDRIRRRPPGADSGGLGTHLDPGTLDLWMTAGLPEGVPAPVRRHRRAVRPVGRRLPHRRSAVPRHARCARCSAPSRAGPRCPTWTTTRASCTPCRSPRRMAYLMLRPLLADVPDDDMCGVTVNQVFPASETVAPAADAGA